MYEKAHDKFISGELNWAADTIKAALINAQSYGLSITNATNGNPVIVTTSTAHGLVNGDKVSIGGVGGNLAANGYWTVTSLGASIFSIPVTGSAAYTSGGYVVKVSRDEFLSDIPSGAVISTTTVPGRSVNKGGIAGSALFSGPVGASVANGVVVYKEGPAASSSPLIAFIDQFSGTMIVPNGSDILVTWPSRLFKYT